MIAQPLVTDIKGNSLEDGPGIRSVVFFKGCPLRCLWCQNPETQAAEAELWWEPERCNKDGGCMEACPTGALSPSNPFFVDREHCNACFRCVDVCPSTALRPSGESLDVEELVRRLLPYRAYYDATGGGVTLSGGEPTRALGFVAELLERLKGEGIHTLLQTCGLFPLARFESDLLPWLDAIYFDLKLMDPALHRTYCGVTNEPILENFGALLERSRSMGFDLLPRTPLIPGITDTAENLHSIAAFLRGLGVEQMALLPNNPVWLEKRPHLGLAITESLDAKFGSFQEPAHLAEVGKLFSDYGINAKLG